MGHCRPTPPSEIPPVDIPPASSKESDDEPHVPAQFLKRSAAASAAWAGASLGHGGSAQPAPTTMFAWPWWGIGSKVKTGGMGRNEIQHFRKIPGVRIVALCRRRQRQPWP